MRKIYLFIFLFLGIQYLATAQNDVQIQVMQYNLLNYGNLTSYCTSSNNSVSVKNTYFKTIFNYVKPDILTVNEMSGNAIYQDSLLHMALNVDGKQDYKRASMTSASVGDWLVNMLYYNSKKLTLYKHTTISTPVRPTDVFQLYYNAFDLADTEDTVFITCIVTHLKAGSTSSDQDQRTNMVNSIMSYIQSHDLKHNYLLMGDFNAKRASETAYSNTIKSYSGTTYLYDPIDSPGDWYSDYTYRFIHTQSPRTTSNGCASSGGLDDRFDFILASDELMNGSNGMHILTDTYHSLGNDGLHFNTSILANPENTSAPTDVINALYQVSDHLPVLVKIQTDRSYLSIKETPAFVTLKFQNPVHHELQLKIAFKQASSFGLKIFDVMGHLQWQKQINTIQQQHQLNIDLSDFKNGIYFLQIKNTDGKESIYKFFKD